MERAAGLRAFSGTTGMPEWDWVEFIDENVAVERVVIVVGPRAAGTVR